MARYDGVVVEDNFLGPIDVATGRMDVMRPTLLPFADGYKLFPDSAIGMTAQERVNCLLPKRIFILGGACVMVPYSFGEWREAIQNEIKSTDIRKKPSHWRCVERIYLAASKKQQVSIVSLGAAYALHFYCIGESGDAAALWRHLKALGVLVTLDSTFPWTDCIRGQIAYDGFPTSGGRRGCRPASPTNLIDQAQLPPYRR